MASGDAPSVINDAAGTTAAPFALTSKHKQFAVTNLHATQLLHVYVGTGGTSAAAKAKVTTSTGTVAVAASDDVYTINPGQRVVVGKSGRRTYWALSALGSGAGTTFIAVGSDWTDGG